MGVVLTLPAYQLATKRPDLLVLLVQARAQLLRGVQRLASQAEGLSAAS